MPCRTASKRDSVIGWPIQSLYSPLFIVLPWFVVPCAVYTFRFLLSPQTFYIHTISKSFSKANYILLLRCQRTMIGVRYRTVCLSGYFLHCKITKNLISSTMQGCNNIYHSSTLIGYLYMIAIRMAPAPAQHNTVQHQ